MFLESTTCASVSAEYVETQANLRLKGGRVNKVLRGWLLIVGRALPAMSGVARPTKATPPGVASLPLPPGEGWGGGFSVRSGMAQRLAPGAARHAGYFLWPAKESNQRNAAPVCRPLRGFPVLLDWSGGCGTRAARSNSPRRHPLTSLRYSAAHRGKKSGRCCVRYAHDSCLCSQRSVRYAGYKVRLPGPGRAS